MTGPTADLHSLPGRRPDDSAIIAKKAQRLREGRSPRVVDLFAGCGGLSLGFKREGFKLLGAVEIDAEAAQTYANNFHPEEDPVVHERPRDVTLTEPADFITEICGESVNVSDSVDVLIGAPPCQSFARVGRAKLRETMDDPEAFLADERSVLYERYIEFVRQLRPLALLMENVPDILNYGRRNLGEEICDHLENLGYKCAYTLLNAAHHGVPEMRTRVFLLGIREELDIVPSFPLPTHECKLPRGYEGSKQVALRTLTEPLFNQFHYVPRPVASHRLPPAVTAEQALRDLPRITAHLNGGMKRGTRRFDTLAPYRRDVRPSAFGRMMRGWLGYESKTGIRDHVIRSLPRDYAIFRAMKPGDQYPQAHALALRMLERKIHRLRSRGKAPRAGEPEYEQLLKQTVPPYSPNKFPNKWRKMESDKPARTLMAHIGKDTYSHIHYDSSQARTISVREAARLQSFPDGFIFSGRMNSAFRQIGNAVPPLLSAAIAKHIRVVLEGPSEALARQC